MPNRWVEFVKKWSAENKMNYMCAMTTKECKDAYLKEYPKEPKKAKKAKGTYDTIQENGALIWDIQQLMDKVVSLGAWSGSLDDIKAIAKKHNVGITKYLRKTELATLDSIIKGLENDDTRENVFHFFGDIYAMLDRYARSKVQKELVDMGKKAMKVADKRANIQMELSEIGKKAKLKEAQKEAQDYLASKVPKKVIIRKKKAPKADAPNTDVARFQEAETNPALKVLTNADLLKMIGSFTKGMKRPYTAVKGVRGKLRDDLLAFFKPIFQTPEYKMVWYGDEKEPTDDVNDGEVDFKGVGIFKWKDILYIIEEITLKKDKYDQKNFGYKNDMDTLVAKLFVKSADAKDDFLKVEKRSPTGLWKDSVSVKIPIPPKIKDSKFRYYGFRADPNA